MSARPGAPAAAAAEVWLDVMAELVAGVHHSLNNRVGALAAVAQVLAGEMPADHPLRAALADEVERLQGTVRSLTLLPRHPGAAAEPVLVPELVRAALELYGFHHGVRDTVCAVEGEPDVLPVYADPARLAHLLLALLIAAGETARAAGAGVRLRYAGDARWVTLTVEATPELGGESPARVEALRPWAEELGGELAVEGAARFELRLPTLPEVRRREREAAAV